MTKGKGYLLPTGDASEDELECCLVFYPARDEYRRALMGSLDYLATWIAWERDSEKRGQDAAASWKLANIQTWECCNMGYCDDLLTTLQALLAATQALECCGDQDLTDGKQYTDEVVDGVDDVPQNIIDSGYADDVDDWDGFDDYKCMIAHLAVDHIESFLRQIAPHISDTGIVIGGVGVIGALVGAILALAGLPISAGIIMALGAASAIWTWITGEGRDAVEDLADEIAASHDDLACAIYRGDGVAQSVINFNDKIDELFSPLNVVAIRAINIEPQLRAMYAGRYDQEDIAQNLADLGYDTSTFDCTCEISYEVDLEYDFDDGQHGWSLTARSEYHAQGQWCNVESAALMFNSNTMTGARASDSILDMFAYHSIDALSGGERFYVQYVQFYWRPCPEVNKTGFFYLEGSYAPDGFDREVAGFYERSWTPGNEIQLSGGDEAGIYCPSQGGPTGPTTFGYVYKWRIAGYVAEGS